MSEGGAVAAEFAVILPSVVAILMFSLGLLATQTQSFKVEQAAAIVARALGRHESETLVKEWLTRNLPDSSFTTKTTNGIFCATVKQRLRVGITLPGFELTEQSCVWVGQSVPT